MSTRDSRRSSVSWTREVEDGGRGGQRDVGAVGQAEQPEGAGLGGLQLAVAELEGGLHREVAGLELVQAAALVGELRGEHRHRPGAARGEAGGGDADGERQEAAGGHHVEGRLAFGAHPLLADDPGEQLERLVGGHHVQVDQVRADQVDHPDPAGDERRAARGARQQRPDLGGVAGVVEQYQYPAAVEGRAEQGRALLHRVGDRRVRRAERAQEGAEHRLGLGGPRARALEVDVQLAVREVRAGRVGDVHREGGLADASDAGQRGDRHHGRLGAGRAARSAPVRRRRVR